MARRKRRSARKGSTFNKNILATVGYSALGEPILDQLASKLGLGLSDDLVKGIAGFLIAQNTTGVVSQIGKSAVTISAYKFGKTGLSGIGNLFGASSNQVATQNNGKSEMLV
jgi:hypothetical protein